MIFFCCELKAIDKSWWKKLLVHARISHFAQDDRLNHHVSILKGPLQDNCRQLMQDFFRAKRSRQ